MLAESAYSDTSFSFPACDDPASTEIGVVVLGLPAGHLLAGLGGAELADDAAQVMLLVDYLRHGGAHALTLARLVAAGVSRWRAAQPVLATAGPVRRHPLRHAWSDAYLVVSRLAPPAATASTVYLTACWLRESEVSQYVADASLEKELTDVVSEVTAP
jgi:Family of unknown function (DUF6187)